MIARSHLEEGWQESQGSACEPLVGAVNLAPLPRLGQEGRQCPGYRYKNHPSFWYDAAGNI